MIEQIAVMLFWMLVSHAVADYPLQGDFLAKAKNHAAPIPGVPWWIALAAHSLIHAGAVMLITGSLLLAVAEFWCHMFIDHAKCRGLFGFTADQALHVACKLAWVAIFFAKEAWPCPYIH